MAKFLISLSILVAVFAGSNTFVVSPNYMRQVLTDNEIALSKGFKPIAGGKAVCETPACTVAAANLINSMDTTADPCQDFFQYACGGWIKKNPIPSSKSRWTQFDVLREQLTSDISTIVSEATVPNDPIPVNQARDFYASCMDTATLERLGLKPLTDLLNLFGGWPMTLTSWRDTDFDWQAATATGRQLYGVNYFLTVYNYLDSQNTSRSSIYIDQGSLALARGTLVNPNGSPAIMSGYAQYMTDAARAIRESLGNAPDDSQIARDVDAVWKFESELAKITSPAEDRRNSTALYNPLLLTQIQGWTDSVPTTAPQAKINWSKYLNDIYGLANIEIPDNERIIVVEPEYLKKLVSLLDITPARTVANYIHWRFVYSLSAYTNQQMRDLQNAFNQVLYGTTSANPRKNDCANQDNDLLGFGISSEYVKRFFPEVAKTETELMIKNLKTAFKTLVDDATWMDPATKNIAREKADYMSEFVAYPDWIKDKTALEAYYNGLQITRTGYFQNVQSGNTFLNKEDFKTLRGPTDRNRWNTFPTIVNAFYEPERNSITFPAGILQVPFYGFGRLANMNYGGIGAVIGHEITHGFDDQGRQSDKDGNTANWWTEETLKNYNDRAQCFIDQYNGYTVPSGTHVNGITTQGENIADNGGLRETYRAYQFYVAANGAEPQLPGLMDFTSEQLFYLSYANVWCGTETPERLENQILTDPHSPSKFRVLGPLSNDVEFSRAFNCPAGSPMNPVKKCVLW